MIWVLLVVIAAVALGALMLLRGRRRVSHVSTGDKFNRE